MSNNSIIPVILSGGSGSRLWPLSRKHYPKQFLPLFGDKTMLQETVARLVDMSGTQPPVIVCNEEHRFLVAEQMQQMGQTTGAILLEPIGRNTAPAVVVAALHALQNNDDPLLLVLPADHVIQQPEHLHTAINEGVDIAMDGKLVTFGIVPHHAETGYGYIEKGERLLSVETACQVKQFVEKPDQQTAQAHLDSGDYLWNSGMFLFQAKQYLAELEMHEPQMLKACQQALQQATVDFDFTRLHKESFMASPAESIDYAVMEKTNNAAVIPLDAGWSDVGSWSSLWEVSEQDEQGNVQIGDVLTTDTDNSYLYSSGRLVATVGLSNHIVIETADAVLVADKNKSQDVKEIVNLLKECNCLRSETHRKVYRPWGNYDSVDEGERFQVKRIVVNSGATLSLQMHYHRAEHWIVVKGTARVTRGNETLLLEENQSTYIPLGTQHRLENPGTIPLEIIEVQSGSYLGEDDIVRFDDVYGRAE